MTNFRPLHVDPCGIGHAIGVSAECAGRLREAGLLHGAAYVQDATSSLRHAQRRVLARVADELQCSSGSPSSFEELTLEDGRSTGTMLVPVGTGLGRLVPTDPAQPVGRDNARPRMATVAHRDLGCALLSSPTAISFAEDDLSAALLRRALAGAGWIEQVSRSRWATSDLGSATILRLMRSGRPAPALRTTYGSMLDFAAVGMIADLGWLPELAREDLRSPASDRPATTGD